VGQAARHHAADLATLKELVDRLPDRARWIVEVGAWDGTYLSTSREFVTRHDYFAVLVEADRMKFAALNRLYDGEDRVFRVHRLAGWDGAQRLDEILAATPIPRSFDVLVIDVDGNDYHLWRALERYRPTVVMIEFNATIPNGVDFVQPADHRVNWSSSIDSIEVLAREKRYGLAACSAYNAFFVDASAAAAAGVALGSSHDLRTHRPASIFFGMDGTVFIDGATSLPSHGIPISVKRLQQMPRFLRRHPDSYGRVSWRLFRLYRWWRSR
jgi:hypothetical protein